MTDREPLADPGRDAALTIAARIFGDERHIPRRTCLGCGGAGARNNGAVSWDCDGSGPTVNGDWSPEFHAWSEWQYAAFMHQSHGGADPGPEPTKPKPGQSHDWTYSFTWAQIRERAEALAVGEQVGAFDAATVAEAAAAAPVETFPPIAEPEPTPARDSQVREPAPTCARCRHAIRNTYGDGMTERDGRQYHGRCAEAEPARTTSGAQLSLF